MANRHASRGRFPLARRSASAARAFASTLSATAALLAPDQKPEHLAAYSVDKTMAPADRRAIPARLAGPGHETTVITNARLLTEGVDVPALDAVLFTDPRNSIVDAIQAIGRVLRAGSDPGKTETIIVPEGADAEAVLDDSAFATVGHVVRTLRAHDERLSAWLDEARASAARLPQGTPSTDDGTPPPWIEMPGSSAGRARDLLVRAVTMGTPRWFNGYEHAAACQREHGHPNAPLRYVNASGYHVGKWVVAQRTRHRRGELPTEQERLLTELGIDWKNLTR
ncbi:Helicase associated domain protein [Actinocorallia sp. API 0066]|uniref:helicase associated domain-containing protein n=1 Tax=Actinocorallia sp. API 0066 TaxID=2896846 RepID=UPI001E53CEA7|nr:helicase associated domain-containing protein [Actinocorallia sp. API 0066]MCD0449460.1 Helicase associated domain protein [Actinocorallia sp. API 0066]